MQLAVAIARLQEERALQGDRGRAALAVLGAAPASRAHVLHSLRAGLGELAAVIDVRETPASRTELRRLNSERDLLLGEQAFIVFLVTTGAEARFLKRHCKDLTAVVDLQADVEAATEGTWSAAALRLRRALADRHQFIDLTGLVPHSGEPVRLPMGETYLAEGGLADLHRNNFPDASPLLLLAPPGSGKSTTLRYVCWSAAAGAAEVGSPARPPLIAQDRLAVYLPLAAWHAAGQDRALPLDTFTGRYLGELIGEPPIDVRPQLSNLVLLLDGLDEVPSRDMRRDLLAQAAALAKEGAQVLVTARDFVADDLRKVELEAWRPARLRELRPEDGLKLVDRILVARHGADDVEAKQRATALSWRIQHDPELREFARRPLLLTFLVILADLGRELPTHRTELYRDLVEMLIASWRHLRTGVRGGPTLRRADVLRVLAPLGWHLVSRGVGGLSRLELLELLTELERAREPDPALAREVAARRLEQLEGDTALLRTDGLWRFNHPTLAEYLAARAVLQDARVRQEVCADPYRPELTQVVAFATSLATDIEPRDEVAAALADALDQRASRRGRYDSKIPRVVAAVVEEARGLPASRRRVLVEHALRVTLAQALSPAALDEAWIVLLALLHHHELPGVPEAAAAWLVPPKGQIRWEAIARQVHQLWGTGGVSPLVSDLMAVYRVDLSVTLMPIGLDPRPLLRAWATHSDVGVRCLFWSPVAAFSEDGERSLRELDPEVGALLPPAEAADPPDDLLGLLSELYAPVLPAREEVIGELRSARSRVAAPTGE